MVGAQEVKEHVLGDHDHEDHFMPTNAAWLLLVRSAADYAHENERI